MKHTNKFRKFINDIHLWLGLGVGIILFVICLSGTIYVFKSEIEYLINPNKYQSTFTGKEKSIEIEKLISNLQKQEKGKVVSVTIPEDRYKNYQLGLMQKSDNKGKEHSAHNNEKKEQTPKKKKPTVFYIDPYTGKIMGKDGDGTSRFFRTMLKLHRWLLIDDSIGRPITGTSTLIFIILSISGLILWLPRKIKYWKQWKHWKSGFKIKFSGKWKRINYDLHNTLGFYTGAMLFIMAITGLCWSFDWYKEGMSKLMRSEIFAGRKETAAKIERENTAILPLQKIISISNKEFPYEGDVKLSLPKDSATAVVINKNKNGFFALSAPDKVQINPYNGNIISVDRFKTKPLNVQIVSLVKPLHTGEIFGTFSKIIYFLVCLIGASLPITGFLIWINKKRKTKK